MQAQGKMLRRRLQSALLLLVVGAVARGVAGHKELPRGFGPRFLDVGFEVNPFSRYSQMRGEEEPSDRHR